MTTWFTSDTHFNHARIIELSHRPFASIEEMNAQLIKNWNSKVKPEDTIYHIGDFAMGDRSLIPGILSQLKGKIILIKGNHDLRNSGDVNKYLKEGVAEIHDELFVTVENHKLYMRHVPKMDFAPSADALYHICGHVHESWNRAGVLGGAGLPMILNAGVDVHNFYPTTLAGMINMPVVLGEGHRGY